MKKVLILILSLLLMGCSPISNKETEIKSPIEIEYIKPTNDVEVFNYINSKTRESLYNANGQEDVKTIFLECLGKELLDYEFTDYFGNKANFKDFKDDKLIIEVSANWCTHCMKQASEYNDELIEAYPDVKIIQFFNEGTKEQIDKFYKEIQKDIPKDITVIPEDKGLSNILLSTYNLKYYPDFLIFNKGILTWEKTAELTKEQLDLASNIAFNDGLDLSDLVDEEGKSIFTYRRTANDVKDDLGSEKYAKLEQIDNDGCSISQTLEYIGKDMDLNNQLSNESSFVSEVKFEDLHDKDLAIFYVNEANNEIVQMLNEFQNTHPEIYVIALNTVDDNVELMANKLNCHVVSIMNQIPKRLNEITFTSHPSAVFVEKGIITGIYSNIKDLNTLNYAADIFIGENAIARIKTN